MGSVCGVIDKKIKKAKYMNISHVSLKEVYNE